MERETIDAPTPEGVTVEVTARAPAASIVSLAKTLLVCIAGLLIAFPAYVVIMQELNGVALPCSNEQAVIELCRNLETAQERFQQHHVGDATNQVADVTAAFGTFRDLIESHPPCLDLPGAEFVALPGGGEALRHMGYLLQLHLSAEEAVWRCYAWPSSSTLTGKRAFFVERGGVVAYSMNRLRPYSGTALAPPRDAVTTDGGHWRRLGW